MSDDGENFVEASAVITERDRTLSASSISWPGRGPLWCEVYTTGGIALDELGYR